MSGDDHISKIWYAAILGATLALFAASLSSSRPESEKQMDEGWLTSLREQGW